MRGLPSDLRWLLRLVLYLSGGIVLGWYLLAHPTPEALKLLAVLMLLVYLSIPVCCGIKK